MSYEEIASSIGYNIDDGGTELSFNMYKDYLEKHFTIKDSHTYNLESFLKQNYSSVKDNNSVVTCFWKDRHHIDNIRAIRIYPYEHSKDYVMFRQPIYNFRMSNINKEGITGIIIISR